VNDTLANAALGATRETLYQRHQTTSKTRTLGNSLEAANDGALDLMKASTDIVSTPMGEYFKWLLTLGASTREVRGTTIATGGLGGALARGIGFVGELAQGKSLGDALQDSQFNAVTFGSGLIASTNEIKACSSHEAHELGHVEQAKYLGPAYLFAYLLTMTGSHDSHPAELNANRQAGLDEHGRARGDWKNPWPGCR